MPASTTILAHVLEFTLVAAGLLLLWRYVCSPTARATQPPSLLLPWEGQWSDLMLFLWLVIAGGLLFPMIAQALVRLTPLDEQTRLIIVSAAFQLGMLAGFLLHRFTLGRQSPLAPVRFFASLVPGAVTFLVSLPLIVLVSLAWLGVLHLLGIPPERQDMVRLFTETKSPALLIFMTALAMILAPVTEELIFRAGLFRFVRTRLPRWAALLLPACFFAALHNSFTTFAPLVVLGLVFSLTYERTGRIAPSIIAHGLFNGYSVLRIFIDPHAT